MTIVTMLIGHEMSTRLLRIPLSIDSEIQSEINVVKSLAFWPTMCPTRLGALTVAFSPL